MDVAVVLLEIVVLARGASFPFALGDSQAGLLKKPREIYADREGMIRYWKAGAVQIFGYARGEAIGRPLIPERLRSRHREGFRRMMTIGASRDAAAELPSVPRVTKAGAALSIRFSVAPVRDDGGRTIGIVVVLRNVTRDYLEMKDLRAHAPGS